MRKLNVAQALLPARGATRRTSNDELNGTGRLRRRADRSVCATSVGDASTTLRTVMLASLMLLLSPLTFAATLRVNGSTTVNPVATEAAEILRAEKKLAITV
ncbi:MAG: hypothetical protein ACSLFQ_02890, partial [Thermoanaerobaculia bacterium]